MNKLELQQRTAQCQTRTDLIRAVVDLFGYTDYLEIGCRKNETFDAVQCPNKVGVDPIEGGTHRTTSDDFFKQCGSQMFDVIFIDGDHHHDQVVKDVTSALRHLTRHGTLLMHDCSPPDAAHEGKRDYKCGTAWRAYAELRQWLTLNAVVADWDFGTGILRWGRNPSRVTLGKGMDDLTYADFDAHRTDWMRLADREQIAAWLWEQKQLTDNLVQLGQ